jgi:iron-sulfur cluster insertion protein
MLRRIVAAALTLVTGCRDNGGSPENIASKVKQQAVVTLTPAAVAKLHEAKQPGKPYLRVSVVRHGATSFMYDLKFDDRLSVDNDYIHEANGITTVVDKTSAILLEGATIDWQTTSDGRQGFQFDNPNAVK